MTITISQVFDLERAFDRLEQQQISGLGVRGYRLFREVRAALDDSYRARAALLTDENSISVGPGARRLKEEVLQDPEQLQEFNTQVKGLLEECLEISSLPLPLSLLAGSNLSGAELRSLAPILNEEG